LHFILISLIKLSEIPFSTANFIIKRNLIFKLAIKPNLVYPLFIFSFIGRCYIY